MTLLSKQPTPCKSEQLRGEINITEYLFALRDDRLLQEIMLSDSELLQQYVDDGSETSFTTLVHRHIDGVYRVALRRVGGNAHTADDVAQRVFTALAQKARTLKGHQSLAGWLYTATRFAAAELVRAEQRRRRHEEEAHVMRENTMQSNLAIDQLDPCLDDVLEKLAPSDREAVLLHFLEQRSFVEIAQLLSLNPDAVRMRVNRALERMRLDLLRRGVTSTTAAVGTAFAAESLQAAPPMLADTIARKALAQAGATAAAHAVATTKIGVWIVSAAAIGMLTTALFLARAWLASRRNSAAEPPRQPAASVTKSATPDDTSAAPVAPNVEASAARSARMPAPAMATVSEFGALSSEEKNILTKLWWEEHELPRLPSGRWALRVGERAPNHDGVAPLLGRRWISYNSNGGLWLTKAGYEFCRVHRTEIETYAKAMDNAPR